VKKLMFVALLLAVSISMFASTQTLQRASVLSGTYLSDTVGATPPTGARDSAFVYAKFAIAGVAFAIVSQDVWFCSSIVPDEDIIETSPMYVLNTGGVAIDLGALVVDEDINSVGDVDNDWVFDDAASFDALPATAPNLPNHYLLAMVFGDNVTASMAATDILDNDVLGKGAMSDDVEWYASGTFLDPLVGSYAHEGTTSLNLWAGPNDGNTTYNEATDEDVVTLWFRVLMSSAGAGDTDDHAAQVKLAAGSL